MGQQLAVAPERVRELADLTTAHTFLLAILEEQLGHAVPVPGEVTVAGRAGRPERSLAVLRRWLNLLDHAITPPMLRDALKSSTARETAEALLRYFAQKASAEEPDRDKSDLVATFLCRDCKPSYQHDPASPQRAEFLTENAVAFEQALAQILDAPPVTLPQQGQLLLQEFHFFSQEVEDFRHFDEITDSEIVRRVRDTKACFGNSFYHPRVLATVAAYNSFFGARFDELFHLAAKEIKAFATQLQAEGGSIMTRLSGDIRVKDLTEVQASRILEQEYGRAKEDLRRVSKLKKVVDSHRREPATSEVRSSLPPASRQPGPRARSHSAAPPPAAVAGNPPRRPAAAGGIREEEGGLRNTEGLIRGFVAAASADEESLIVPLRNSNVGLSGAEIEAHRMDFGTEKSFRADYFACLRRIVALRACMTSELVDYRGKKTTSYLWKPHADTLTRLMSCGNRTAEEARDLLALAQERGLQDKIRDLSTALQKLSLQLQEVAEALQ